MSAPLPVHRPHVAKNLPLRIVVIALATAVGVLVLTSWWLLPVATTDGWRRWPALALWQGLVAVTVLIPAGHPTGLGQRLPSDYVLCAASGVTAYRATAAGHAGMLALLGGSAVALVPAAALDEVTTAVTAAFARAGYSEPAYLLAPPAAGARLLR